jgi:hypothetical protein
MKKEILNEINRYRELMSLKEINLINEGAVGDYLSKIGLATIKDDIEAFMKSEAKKLAEEEMKKGTVTSFRAGQQGSKNISNETVESVLKQIESKGSKTLTTSQRLTATQQIRRAMAEEVKNSINQSVKELAEQIGKKSTPSATWQAIKKHFGNNWGKYLAAGIVAAIFAYYWPYEKTPEPQPEPQPKPQPKPQNSKYKVCTKFPYEMFCKSEDIRKVQQCIGVKDDGYLGPKTEAALKANGYSVPLTKEDYDKIIAKCSGTQPTPPPTERNPLDGEVSLETETGEVMASSSTLAPEETPET